MAAPASAAPIACSATSTGVSGRYGLIVGVWIDPVTAQVMMTFPDLAMTASDSDGLTVVALPCGGQDGDQSPYAARKRRIGFLSPALGAVGWTDAATSNSQSSRASIVFSAAMRPDLLARCAARERDMAVQPWARVKSPT